MKIKLRNQNMGRFRKYSAIIIMILGVLINNMSLFSVGIVLMLIKGLEVDLND